MVENLFEVLSNDRAPRDNIAWCFDCIWQTLYGVEFMADDLAGRASKLSTLRDALERERERRRVQGRQQANGPRSGWFDFNSST